MTPAEFLRSAETQRQLELSAQLSGLPVSVHALAGEEEGPLLAGAGACRFCTRMNASPGGRKQCRASRAEAGAQALRQQAPVAFVCHAGLSALSFPILPGHSLVGTLGPFVPVGNEASLEEELAHALSRWHPSVNQEGPGLSVDIRRIGNEALLAAAQWLGDSLRASWRASLPAPDMEAQAEPSPGTPQAVHLKMKKKLAGTRLRGSDDAWAAHLALLFYGAQAAQGRMALLEALEADLTSLHRGSSSLAGHAFALGTSVLDAAVSAGLDTGSATEALLGARMDLDQAGTPAAMASVVGKALRLLAAQPPGRNLAERCHALHAAVLSTMPDGISLGRVAALTGDSPTAITHRLQRNFGFSYSEHLGWLRVEQAKRLLRTTRLSATAVARRVGLSDQSNFTKIFKRHAGMTPLEYRERYGKQ